MAGFNHIYRFLRRSDDDDDADACGNPHQHEHAKDLSIGVTAQMLFFYIGLVCLTVTFLSGIFLIWRHLRRYLVPSQQKHIVRIIALPPMFCAISVLCIYFDKDAIYLIPIMDVYEAFCVAGLFMLLVDFVTPDGGSIYQVMLETPMKTKQGGTVSGGSLPWFRKTYAKVLQFPLVRLILAIVEICTQAAGVYCENSMKPRYAHVWVEVIGAIATTVALLGLIEFYKRFNKQMDPFDKAGIKFISMKGIVFLRMVQSIIFGIVNDHYTPTRTITFNDMAFTIPSLLVAIECLLFSLLYYYSFGSRCYTYERKPGRQALGTFRAAANALNISDVIVGVFVAVGRIASGRSAVQQMPRAPRRQRTAELDNMGYEPYKVTPQPSPASENQGGYIPEQHAPPQQAYYAVDGQQSGQFPQSGYQPGAPPRY